MARRMRRPRLKKPKKVAYQLIAREGRVGTTMYALLDEIVGAFHGELAFARIGLAWCTSWKADPDGRITIGKCKKASDLDRELAAYDVIILLSPEFWHGTDEKGQRALVDHELSHATLKHGEDGEPVEDERGRKVYRIRKHDLEEFRGVVERHGCYKRDLEDFAAALRRGPQLRPAQPDCPRCDGTGWHPMKDGVGVGRMRRCECRTPPPATPQAPLPLAREAQSPCDTSKGADNGVSSHASDTRH